MCFLMRLPRLQESKENLQAPPLSPLWSLLKVNKSLELSIRFENQAYPESILGKSLGLIQNRRAVSLILILISTLKRYESQVIPQ